MATDRLLTAHQRAALTDLVAFAADHGVTGLAEWQLSIHVEPEATPGRGHDIRVSWSNSDYIVTADLDPYGNGQRAVGAIDWLHLNTDENPCTTCDIGTDNPGQQG